VSAPIRLVTARARLVLKELAAADAESYFVLVQLSRDHLTAFGDYDGEVSASLDEVRAALSDANERNLRFGIRFDGELVGRIDLVPVDPPRYAIGYWLGVNATGKGFVTIAAAALIDFAREQRSATDIFAGVTHGNVKSVAVLERLGFQAVNEFDTYTRYHLPLSRLDRSLPPMQGNS
jgi:RimJ/RimL family protein N-acetyltransferase